MTSQKTPPQGPAGERPSLFDGTTAAGPPPGQADNLRMLSGLGAAGKPAASTGASRRGWRVAAGVAVVVLAGVAAALWLGGRPSAPGETLAKAAGPEVFAASAPAAPNTDAAASAAAVAGDGAGSAAAGSASAVTATAAAGPAVIEGVAPDAASAPASSDPFAKMAAADTAAAASSPGDVVAAAAAPAASPVTASAHGASKARHASANATRVAQADPPKRKPLPTAQRRSAASVPDAGKADSDVELLTALMAHLEGGVGTSPTIAQLVRECRKLAGDQALQCRRRICDGYWGKAQACPARIAPRGAVPGDGAGERDPG